MKRTRGRASGARAGRRLGKVKRWVKRAAGAGREVVAKDDRVGGWMGGEATGGNEDRRRVMLERPGRVRRGENGGGDRYKDGFSEPDEALKSTEVPTYPIHFGYYPSILSQTSSVFDCSQTNEVS